MALLVLASKNMDDKDAKPCDVQYLCSISIYLAIQSFNKATNQKKRELELKSVWNESRLRSTFQSISQLTKLSSRYS